METVSKLKATMLKRKASKIIALIEQNFEAGSRDVKTGKSKPRLTLTITPGLAGWPLLKPEVVELVQEHYPGKTWIAMPLFIKTKEGQHLEFMLVTKNTIDCWEVWCSIIQVQYSAFRQGKFNSYQLWVFQHILNVTPEFKKGLEDLVPGVSLEDKPFIADFAILTQAHKAKEVNTVVITNNKELTNETSN